MVRELAAVDRREQLLDAALAAFAAQGYRATKVSDVVARAGVAQGTFYLYFRSKGEVVLALVDRFCRVLLGARESLETTVGDTYDEYVSLARERTRALLERTLEHRALAALFYREGIGAEPEIEEQLRAFRAQMSHRSAAQLDEAVARGYLRPHDTKIAALAINGMWERVILDLVLRPGAEPDLDRIVEAMLALQLEGLRARPMREEKAT